MLQKAFFFFFFFFSKKKRPLKLLESKQIIRITEFSKNFLKLTSFFLDKKTSLFRKEKL
jgi:hypothetical protein